MKVEGSQGEHRNQTIAGQENQACDGAGDGRTELMITRGEEMEGKVVALIC
jgi:hypothetical protein